jgi:hypothetical protein
VITLTANITIGTLAFSHAASVTCESGWQRMGDKCTVSFPRNIEVQGKRVGEILKAGQPASVALGYDGKNTVVLAGKVSRVSPEMPVVVEIEDGYYDLRRSSISKAYKQVSLKELLADILPGTETVVPEIALGKLRFDQITVARVLLELQKTFGIYSYFRDGKLHSGFAYAKEPAAVHKFSFQKNIVSSSLSFVEEAERKIKVKATSFMPDGKTISVELGDADGDQRTLHYYGLDATQLKAVATAEISRLQVSGYEGDIVVLGQPTVRHGDAVELSDERLPDRTGMYFVDQVTTSWGMSGFRQTLKLGKKA